jgi:hypothetical protein
LLSTGRILPEREYDVKQIMSELITGAIEQEQQPFARSYDEWKEHKQQRFTATQFLQLERLTPLFEAYRQEKSADNEHDLIRWVMRALTVKAKAEYRRAYKSDEADQAAESIAAENRDYIWRKLKEGHFKEAGHLQATIANFCKQFRSEAYKSMLPKAEEVKTIPLNVRWTKDGQMASFEKSNSTPKTLIHTPSSDPATAAENVKRREERAKSSLIVIPEGKMRNFLTRENNLFLSYLPASDVDLFRTLEDCEWERAEAALCLNADIDTINQQVSRIAKKFQQMRMLLIEFRLPQQNREPIEHKDDLTDRFVRFADRLQRLSRADFPKTFSQAFAQCAEDQSYLPGDVLYERHEVMSHLLRLWRKTQTTQ